MSRWKGIEIGVEQRKLGIYGGFVEVIGRVKKDGEGWLMEDTNFITKDKNRLIKKFYHTVWRKKMAKWIFLFIFLLINFTILRRVLRAAKIYWIKRQ